MTLLARDVWDRGLADPFTRNHNGERLIVEVNLSEVKHTTSNIVVWQLNKGQLHRISRTAGTLAGEMHADHLDIAGPTDIIRHLCLRQVNRDVEDDQLFHMCRILADIP